MKRELKDLNPQKILIRSTNWIGDAIMTTPAVRSIRENFPEAHISILALPWVADVFAASPYVDEVILYRKKDRHQGLYGLWRLSQELAARKFDLAILLQNAFEAALIAKLSGIPVRAGYKRDARGMLLTHGVRIPKKRKKIHQVYYYQGLLEDLGLTCGKDELFLELSKKVNLWAKELVASFGAGPVVGLNPGAAYGPAKRWPSERYGDLARRLHDELGATVVVFGAEADAACAAAIKEVVPRGVVDMAGKTSLEEAMALIGKCHCFVTNDSGLMHVGAALKVPLVAIFGSTNAIATGPFSDNAVVVQKDLDCRPCLKTHCKSDFRCMKDITVDEVYGIVEELLNKSDHIKD